MYEAITCQNRTAEFVYPHKVPNATDDRIVALAQAFGLGRLKIAPEFFASLAGLAWCFLLVTFDSPALYFAGMALGVIAAAWCCSAAKRLLKPQEARTIVLDRIAVMPVCYVAWVGWNMIHAGVFPAPQYYFRGANLPYAPLVFALFRFFDVLKPWPSTQSYRLSGGWDVMAGALLSALFTAAMSLLLVP